MKAHILILGFLAVSAVSSAQTPLSSANCDISLRIGGDYGTNGVAVAYNPKANVYYTLFAGNTSYPLEAHNATTGESLSTQESGFDARGMWYNPSKKCLEGIAYDNNGGFEVVLDSKGMINGTRATSAAYGMEAQSVATYAEKLKSVMFIQGTTAYFFKKPGAAPKTVDLAFDPEGYFNTNGPIYTGVKNYEIGLFNAETGAVHLFSAKNGSQTAVVQLNTSSCNEDTEMPGMFRISYANNRVFMFDYETRVWSGYKLF